jgi:TetR/AcrR family transcriptional regulator, repressor of fatR-cypB operon
MAQNIQNNQETLPRREREKLAHRQAIFDAAVRVFAKKGFASATLDEIAQEAEFSKGALYLYFSSKEDILYNIMKDISTIVSEIVRSTFTGESSFSDELREFYRGIATVSFENKDLCHVLTQQHMLGFQVFSPEKVEEFLNLHREIDSVIINRITKAITDRELRQVQPEAVFGLIHGAIENMMVTQWDCKTLDELLEAVDVFLDFIFNGIAKKKEA